MGFDVKCVTNATLKNTSGLLFWRRTTEFAETADSERPQSKSLGTGSSLAGE
jgi:hypothetical protein